MEETRQQAPAGKDLTAIGLEILQSARNELYLNLPYLDVALCSLAFAPGGGMTVSLATDGETSIMTAASWRSGTCALPRR